MRKSWQLGMALMMCGTLAQAGTIVSGGTVIDNGMGEHSWGQSPVADMLNQSGLSANYVSGVTDFDTYIGSGVSHGGGDAESWLSGDQVYSGYLVFDLGSVFNINRFVMWNGTSGITASVNGFSLTTSLVSDFSTSTVVGSFTGQQANYAATVYDMTDSLGRYVRLDIDGNFGNGCCTGIGDLAFDVNGVPEPGTLALLGLGVAGLAASRRRQRPV